VETGLFLDMADVVVMGDANGTASVLDKASNDNNWIDTTIDWANAVSNLKGTQ
jgi:hypothetical protein